jgi:predicted phosphodiesterase
VLPDIEVRGITELWCLGDVVGNGHDPVGCLDRVRARCAVVLAGNHEVAIASQRDDLAPGTQYSRAALLRAGRLDEIAAWKSEWIAEGIRLAHGCPSPFDPMRDYLVDDVAPEDVLEACPDAGVIVLGHTHVPGVWREQDRWLVNAGSVGEPREGDPRPTWVEIRWTHQSVSDVVHHRVAFDREHYSPT